jgi:hypothetical protein
MSVHLFGAATVRSAFRRIILGAALTIITAASAVASSTPALSPDKKLVFLGNGQAQFRPSVQHDTTLSTIFSNFASFYPDGLYMYALGGTISGPASLVGETSWFAAPFTPSKNTVLKEIDVPVSYDAGTNRFVVNLYADGKKVPGTLLKSWIVRNLPETDSCCTFTVVKDSAGVSLKAGKQYWLGLTTMDSTAFFTWDLNSVNNVDTVPYAYLSGGKWTAGTTVPNLAFAIYGE